mmetsp:Transcript_18043/g.38799  ORF Transcript_18043/g.38799 Transcript_18043/m.38799 type:complete len:284 (+) Transcript_18043:3029-3880(+)
MARCTVASGTSMLMEGSTCGRSSAYSCSAEGRCTHAASTILRSTSSAGRYALKGAGGPSPATTPPMLSPPAIRMLWNCLNLGAGVVSGCMACRDCMVVRFWSRVTASMPSPPSADTRGVLTFVVVMLWMAMASALPVCTSAASRFITRLARCLPTMISWSPRHASYFCSSSMSFCARLYAAAARAALRSATSSSARCLSYTSAAVRAYSAAPLAAAEAVRAPSTLSSRSAASAERRAVGCLSCRLRSTDRPSAEASTDSRARSTSMALRTAVLSSAGMSGQTG